MKLNRFLGIILIVGSLFLNSCSVQTREVGFGGGNWSMPKSSNKALAQKNTNVDSVVLIVNSEPTEKDINIVQLNSETSHLIIDKTFVKARKSNPIQKEINILKHNKSNRLVSSKDLGKTLGWTSIILGALASLFSGAKVLSLLLAICGAFIGFVGLKIHPGFIGRILCYAGIALSVFSVFNGLIGSIITVLLLVALILILLILLKKA
jgi:hypothetical protein